MRATGVHHVSAQMLRNARRSIAEWVCARLTFTDPPAGNGSPAEVANRRADQADNHIHVLAACIEFNSPLLLEDYVRWVHQLPPAVSPYDRNIAEFLKQLDHVVHSEFPAEVSGVVHSYIERAIECLQQPVAPETIAADTSSQLLDVQRRYLQALLQTQRDYALQILTEALEAGVQIESVYLQVIQPTQHELGRLWQRGKISVAQEHYCTAATQFIMAQLQPYFFNQWSTDRTMVASCVGDELHEVGLRIVADLFEVSGWNTIYLGANAPASDITETLVMNNASVLAISTTMTQHLFSLAEVIDAVRSDKDCADVKILVGGYPFNLDPFLWQRIGADAIAVDGKEAVRIANRLCGADSRPLATTLRPPTTQTRRPIPSTASDDPTLDLSRLNNTLVTLQRDLNKANLQLATLNESNEEKAAALEQADQRKNEYLAMLAHELRGPLAPLELAVSLLQMDNLNPSIVAEARATMKRQLQQMKHLIHDLLDASRIAHGKVQLKQKPVDLHDVLQRSIEIAHPLMQEKRQTFEMQPMVHPVLLEADDVRLTQVFSNLLTNASKYTPEGGSIELTAMRQRDAVVVQVTDTGLGIEPDLLQEIFAPFSQEQRSRKHSRGGLGLGLSLVKKLVDLHDGSVTASSAGVGQGSTFTVTLPALETTQPIAAVPADSATWSRTVGPARSVLIVEDTAGIARITSILFEKLGHLPETALDGATAIRKFQEAQPDIVVLDLELPDMSGLEVTQILRRLDPDRKTLIAALTGHSDDRHRQLAADSGCDEYLVKPVDIHELQSLVNHPRLQTAPRVN